MTDLQTRPRAGRTGRRARRRQPGPPRRHAQGPGPLRLLLRPARRRDAVGPHAAIAPPARPHPSVDVGPALAIAGVACVVTADDVPGAATYGLITADQPVFARDVVRYVGEPVAAVAADHPDTARRALEAIVVDYEVLPPLVDADGRAHRRRRSTPTATSSATSWSATATSAPDRRRGGRRGHLRGRHAGPGVPRARVGPGRARRRRRRRPVGRDAVAARRPRPGRRLPRPRRPSDVRLHLGGVGGAFGAREDVSLQVHVCLLALRTGRPGEDELPARRVVPRPRPPPSGPHRATATTPPATATLVKVEAEVVLDGGAYASSSSAVIANAACFACGPVPACRTPSIDAVVVRTNNPPCGAMRGFGAVQVCFAHEAQMDRLAAAAGRRPRRAAAAQRPRRRATCCPPASGSPARRRWPSASGPRSPTRCRRPRATACSSGRAAPGAPTTRRARPAGRGVRRRVQEPHVLRGLRRHSEAHVPPGRRRGHGHVRAWPRSARAS